MLLIKLFTKANLCATYYASLSSDPWEEFVVKLSWRFCGISFVKCNRLITFCINNFSCLAK